MDKTLHIASEPSGIGTIKLFFKRSGINDKVLVFENTLKHGLSSVLARLLWRISKRAATSTASRTGWSLFKKLRYFSIKMTCSSVITESFRHFPLSKQSTYSLHLMNIPMCISFLTKKTRPGIFSVALFFQRRTGITQKVRLYIPFLKKKR